MTSSVSAPHVCERIAYSGILSPTKSLVKLKSPSLLPSRNRITRSVLKGVKGGDSRGMLSYEVGMDLFAEFGEEAGSHVD